MIYYCTYHRRIKRPGALWQQMKVDEILEATGEDKENGYSDIRCDWCQDKDDDRKKAPRGGNVTDVFDINRVRNQEYAEERSDMLCFHYAHKGA